MDITQDPQGNVTRLALVRAIRGLSHASLGIQVGVDGTTVFRWERGEPIPSQAMLKRLGLALGWSWFDLSLSTLSAEEAQSALVSARQQAAKLRAQSG